MSGLLTGLFEKRFHVSQEPPGYVSKWATGIETHSGVMVDETSALQYVTVYACIQILAETLASLPCIIYQRLKGGGKERASDFYLYPILHDQVNPDMTAYQFFETVMGHTASWGNGYAQIVWDQAGRVKELWPLRPDRMLVERKNGQLQYVYRLEKPDEQGKLTRTFPAYQILHIPGLGFDGISGYSPIGMARQAIGLGLAAEEFGSRFFGNDARPSYVIEHPAQLSDKAYDRLKKDIEEKHGGVAKSHKPEILEEGMKIKEIGLPPEDAQFLQTRLFQKRELCAIYRIPPHMVGDLEKTTYNNLEQENLGFISHTMRAWLVRWEQCLRTKLLSPNERKKYFAEFLLDGILRGDLKTRYEAYHIARLDGWMNADEIRNLENQNPLPDGKGQAYLIPLNMVTASTPGSQEGREMIVQRAAKTLRGLYIDTIERILRREKNDVLGAAKKFLEKRSFDKFLSWLDGFYAEHNDFISRQMKPLLESHSVALIGEKGDSSEPVKRFTVKFSQDMTQNSRGTVERLAEKAKNEPDFDVFGELEGYFEGQISSRAGQIAEREGLKFGNFLMKNYEEGDYGSNQ